MQSLHNIEKSAFHPGTYVGYGRGQTSRIRKSSGSYGNWWAYSLQNPNERLYAWKLSDLSAKLAQPA